MLINPTEVDPETLIGFREEFVYAKDGNAMADATIRVCGLDRTELNDKRRERLESLRDYFAIVTLQEKFMSSHEGRILVAKARRKLAEAKEPQSEFFAMTKVADLNYPQSP
ncbi:MAG: hypothetical protein EOP06_21370 [Proteobacteria bacterium]|nr:MAG: hypothetical protein EOP06_21370 [Pseudomonadota bacterium]